MVPATSLFHAKSQLQCELPEDHFFDQEAPEQQMHEEEATEAYES
jgi:hypothetical protein